MATMNPLRMKPLFNRMRLSLIVLVAVITSTACAPDPAPPSPSTTPDVILIVVDTLRADFLGCYGAEITTPNIDALADSGLRFKAAFSHIPATGPSHSSMFTGLLPTQHTVTQNAQVLDDGWTTIAEHLQNNGYHTAGVISLGVIQSRFGFGQGFETYNDSFPDQWFRPASEITDTAVDLASATPADKPLFLFVHYSDPHEPYAPPNSPYPQMTVEVDGRVEAKIPIDGLTKRIPMTLNQGEHEIRLSASESVHGRRILFRQLRFGKDPDAEIRLGTGWSQPPGSALEKLNSASLPATLILSASTAEAKGPLRFFAYEDLDATEARRRYAGEVEYVDHQIGRLIEALGTAGRLENAVVILTSDHGEGLGDHNHMGHITQLYDSLVRVPLILSSPGRFAKGQSIEGPVGHIDLVPTILDCLDIEPPARLPGKSLLHESALTADRPILMTTFRPEAPFDLKAAFANDHKLIINPQTGQDELYSLPTDPGETRNLLIETSAESANLARTLTTAIADASDAAPSLSGADETGTDLSEEDIERLRELGYLRDE